MIRKNFKINVFLRLLLITATIAGCLYYLMIEINYLRFGYILAAAMLLFWETLNYFDKINRDLNTFFTSLLQNDFTTTFSEDRKGVTLQRLYSTLNKISSRFKEINTEKEKQLLFLEMLVEHVRSGIISFDKDEKIYLMNHALQKLLKKPRLHYLKALSATDEVLLKAFREIMSGEKRLLKIKINNELQNLSIYASEFKMGEVHYKLLSIQDIKTELEANEVETWQKLIRILTHEIMNSVAPITSLSDTLYNLVEKQKDAGLKAQDLNNLLSGLEAIKMRSSGLENFTHAYRKLTRLPQPSFKKVLVKDFLEKTIFLHRSHYHYPPEAIHLFGPSDVSILADPDLLAQVILNILKNAFEASAHHKNMRIDIEIVQETNTIIKISDNGPGVAPELIDKVFVPFFTTKSDGSGIGLALSRQIMHMHKGSLYLESEHGAGSTFILRF